MVHWHPKPRRMLNLEKKERRPFGWILKTFFQIYAFHFVGLSVRSIVCWNTHPFSGAIQTLECSLIFEKHKIWNFYYWFIIFLAHEFAKMQPTQLTNGFHISSSVFILFKYFMVDYSFECKAHNLHHRHVCACACYRAVHLARYAYSFVV